MTQDAERVRPLGFVVVVLPVFGPEDVVPAADDDRHVPMVETPNLDGKIPCLCGERFATWRDWCRHRGEQR